MPTIRQRIGNRFEKRFAPSLQTSITVPAPPSPTLESLHAENDTIRQQLKALSSEREGLSLAALRGDQSAVARIGAIDSERLDLVHRQETLQAAIRALQQEQRQTGWRPHLPRMGAYLWSEMEASWRHAEAQINRLLLGRQPHDRVDLKAALDRLDVAEREAARVVCDRHLPEVRVTWIAGDHQDERRGREHKAKLVAERNQLIEQVAEELLTTANLKRPAGLVEAIKAAEKRLRLGV